jgi:hypothetical protein
LASRISAGQLIDFDRSASRPPVVSLYLDKEGHYDENCALLLRCMDPILRVSSAPEPDAERIIGEALTPEMRAATAKTLWDGTYPV